MDGQTGQRIAQEVANGLRRGDPADPAIASVGLTLEQALLLQTVDDSRNRAVRQADLSAEVLQTYSIRLHHHVHDAALWSGELTPRELGFDGLPQYLPHGFQVPIDLFRHPRHPRESFRGSHITARMGSAPLILAGIVCIALRTDRSGTVPQSAASATSPEIRIPRRAARALRRLQAPYPALPTRIRNTSGDEPVHMARGE